jgi:hypothetical protein
LFDVMMAATSGAGGVELEWDRDRPWCGDGGRGYPLARAVAT